MHIDLYTIFVSLVALVIGIVLHEFAHALMAHYLGDTTASDNGRITLNPLAHIDPFTTILLPLLLLFAGLPVFAAAKPVPFNPWALRGGKWGAALVAAAGPFTNLLIAVFVSLYMRIIPATSGSFFFLGTIIAVNVGLFIFNMIPVPPLDGSRILYAAVPASVRQIMDQIEHAGLIVIFGLVALLSYTPFGSVLGTAIRSLTSLLLPSTILP